MFIKKKEGETLMKLTPYLLAGLFYLSGSARAVELTSEQKIKQCALEHDYNIDSDALFTCMTQAAGNTGAVAFYRHITSSLGLELDSFRSSLSAASNPGRCLEYRDQFLANFPLEDQLYTMQGKMEAARPDLRNDTTYTTRMAELQEDVLRRFAKIRSFPCEEVQVSER